MGRLLGLALRHRKTLDVRFSGAFLSMLVDGAVSLEHLEEVDKALHRSLCWLLNETDSTKEMDLVFTVTETDRVEEPLQITRDVIQTSLSNHERSRTDADRKKTAGRRISGCQVQRSRSRAGEGRRKDRCDRKK